MQTTHQTIRQTVTMILQGFNAGQVTAMQALAAAAAWRRQHPTDGPMKPSTKGKGWYCPAKLPDGRWCNSK